MKSASPFVGDRFLSLVLGTQFWKEPTSIRARILASSDWVLRALSVAMYDVDIALVRTLLGVVSE